MGKTVNLTQLKSLEKFVTEFSNLSDDYIFTRLTEETRASHLFADTGPVRFDGMSWFLCFGGSLDFEVNLTPASLIPNSVGATRPGSFIELKNIDWKGLDCYMLFVSSAFIQDINFDLNILGTLAPMGEWGLKENPVIPISSDEAALLRDYFEILHHNTHNSDSAYGKSIARCIIAALTYQLIQIVSRRIPAEAKDRPKSRRLTYVHDFINLVHEYHRSERTVAFYADKLFISPKYLSLIIKETIGRSAAEIIDDYVILEAKNLLRFSGKNIQQVSYELNFPNQSSFGKYFKHLTGLSPSEYQRSN